MSDTVEQAEPTEGAEVVQYDPYDLAWEWLDYARATGDTEALETAKGYLEEAIATGTLSSRGEVKRHFGALHTYAYMAVWEVLVAGQAVEPEHLHVVRGELGKILSFYSYPGSGQKNVQRAYIDTLALAIATQNKAGILPLPDAPSRQRSDSFIFDFGDGSYLPVTTRDYNAGVLTLELGRILVDSIKVLQVPAEWIIRIRDLDSEQIRILAIQECADAVIKLADRQSPPAYLVQAMKDAAATFATLTNRVERSYY